MKSAGRERDASRSGLVVALLLASLLFAGALAWQAQASMRYHRVAAEKVLRDYAALAADELARRSTYEIGFSGFYPLVTAVRQEAARGRLLSPADLAASADETLRPAADLVRATLRFAPASGTLETLGPQPGAAARAWMSETLSARGASAPKGPRYVTAHGNVEGRLRTIVFGPAGREAGAPIAGFESNDAAFAARFRTVLGRGPLFPPSLVRGTVGNDALFLRITDPWGREVFRSGAPKQPYLGAERPFGDDYNGILAGFVIHAAVDPAAARSLVIGGLPSSRLPFLLALLALTAGLILTALRQLQRERALSSLRSHFVSRVSHELRTPLTQIRMFSETLLLNRVRSEEERRSYLEIIDRESRRLANLVDNVLRFSRGERGEDRVDPSPQDVSAIARQIVLDFRPLLAGRATLSASIPERVVANVDESAFRQILLNLLDNAAKYGPEGQEIGLALEPGGAAVSVSVEDQGPGIPESGERERIWDRFYRLPRDRESAVAGTGIGLAVVADLARLQGGRAFVENRASGLAGARFVVELPAGPETPG